MHQPGRNGDVVQKRKVPVELLALKDHAHLAPAAASAARSIAQLAVQPDCAAVNGVKPGNRPKQRGLAAAAGAADHQALSLRHCEGQVVKHEEGRTVTDLIAYGTTLLTYEHFF